MRYVCVELIAVCERCLRTASGASRKLPTVGGKRCKSNKLPANGGWHLWVAVGLRGPMVCLHAGVGRVFAAELAQSVASGSLFCLFFVASPGGCVAFAGDFRHNLKMLAVIGAIFIN